MNDLADKSVYRRGRIARRIWAFIQRRAARRDPETARDPLAHGIRFEAEDGLMYVVPSPAEHTVPTSVPGNQN